MRRTSAAAAGLAALVAAYGAGYEPRAFRLRRVTVPVLQGGPPVRILQVSDLHMTPGQNRKGRWVRGLAALEPDLVVNTGDNLAHADALPLVLDTLEPLLAFPGVFVFGACDYWSAVPISPARYLRRHARPLMRAAGVPPRFVRSPSGRPPRREPDLPTDELLAALVKGGWAYAGNRRARVEAAGRVLDVAGVDDPHVHRDRYDLARGPIAPGADLGIGLVHAPYTRVLDAMAADGLGLVLAGHTHGGQWRLPGYGALITNCDLDPAHARGLTRWPDRKAHRSSWLHVSAGLGASPYMPVRLCCPPEATLLTLVPA